MNCSADLLQLCLKLKKASCQKQTFCLCVKLCVNCSLCSRVFQGPFWSGPTGSWAGHWGLLGRQVPEDSKGRLQSSGPGQEQSGAGGGDPAGGAASNHRHTQRRVWEPSWGGPHSGAVSSQDCVCVCVCVCVCECLMGTTILEVGPVLREADAAQNRATLGFSGANVQRHSPVKVLVFSTGWLTLIVEVSDSSMQSISLSFTCYVCNQILFLVAR